MRKALLTRGRRFDRVGHWGEAIETLTTLLRREPDPGDAAAWPLLAMAYLQEGRRIEAQTWLTAMRRSQAAAALPFWERLMQDLFCREAENLFAARAHAEKGNAAP